MILFYFFLGKRLDFILRGRERLFLCNFQGCGTEGPYGLLGVRFYAIFKDLEDPFGFW